MESKTSICITFVCISIPKYSSKFLLFDDFSQIVNSKEDSKRFGVNLEYPKASNSISLIERLPCLTIINFFNCIIKSFIHFSTTPGLSPLQIGMVNFCGSHFM